MTSPAPYPADTRAKGWRFELDYEAIQQSDTWALADEIPMAQPALLMMWLTSWAQIPCGSLPDDEAVIRAKCKVPAKDWARMRDVLMRGWWKADDGRLYHPTITQRVLDMLGRKNAEAKRKADYRARKEAEEKLAAANAALAKSRETGEMSHGTDVGHDGFPEMSHGTDMGQTRDGRGIDATGTGTGTGLDSSNPPPRAGEGPIVSHGTTAGQICKAMRAKGLSDANPGNQKLLTLIDAGATQAEFEGAAEQAVKAQAGFAYALSIVANERMRAAQLATQIHRGRMPAAPPPTETAHARKMREAAQGLAGGVARRSNGAPPLLTVIDLEPSHVPAIDHH